ncbi:MAG: phage protein Gp36 family protein [Thermaurantimonas sp.]|uniref:phage protein Gp36 family protein n=1 Tax=Thermaurantimonas TaxID=2681566 RepID=UPI0023F4B7A9|nr:phage protein Gp36 family protein [Thermaurantimonas aggregans]MCX8149226.1 DUF1320 domain-containing protein [Thermaurantimonas aggregans]
MSFLTKDDLITVATADIINRLTNHDSSIIDSIIQESIALFKSYLSKHYNTDHIFSQAGNARHKTVLKRLKDVVIFEIYERHTREHNLAAKRRYDEAMLWLEKLNTGEFFDLTLPQKQTSENTPSQSLQVRFGSNKKYSSLY